MNKKFRMLEGDIDKNFEKLDEIPREINGIQKATRRKSQNNKDIENFF